MVADLNVFISLDKTIKKRVKMEDGMVRESCGKGIVKVNFHHFSCIKDSLYVPDLDSNLLSVRQFLREGYALVFGI